MQRAGRMSPLRQKHRDNSTRTGILDTATMPQGSPGALPAGLATCNAFNDPSGFLHDAAMTDASPHPKHWQSRVTVVCVCARLCLWWRGGGARGGGASTPCSMFVIYPIECSLEYCRIISQR